MVSSPPPLPPLFLPPPPPPTLRPLLYYFLVVVATAALALALYSVIVLRWCSEQQQHRHHPRDQSSDDHHPIENFRLVSSFKFKKELDYKVRDHEQGYEPPECSICLSVFEEDDELKRLPRCMHCFHANCIDKWLISHLNCPLCRLEVVESMDERRSKETNQLPGNSHVVIILPV